MPLALDGLLHSAQSAAPGFLAENPVGWGDTLYRRLQSLSAG